ncbi:MAG: translocation/assembly module TamB domain-containing protein [Candidatus Eremiobacteraeota bacterium]|nr:translocation/assembly module TamB domain-containing protein [Candidatus Eremiobacteraeota bacterium]
MRASRRAVVVAASVAALLVVLIAARHVIERGIIQLVLSSATGYQITFGSQKLGTRHAAFFDVHVVKNGDPVLDAQRVDLEYALRDIFPGGEHRFGFVSISAQKPVLTITRHADGTLTFNRTGGTPGTPPAPTRRAAAPYYFTARIRDGVIRLVDAAPLQPDLGNQAIEDVSIDASVKSDARTTAQLSGVLLGRRAQGAPVGRYPIRGHSVIDVDRGIALNTIRARSLPLRGALGFFLHTKAIRFDDGLLDDVDLRYYALAPKAGQDFVFRLGGHAQLQDGRITVGALAKPVRDLRAPITIAGDLVAAKPVEATVAGIPVRGGGAMYDLFGNPAFRLGFAADADLHDLRALFTFIAQQPLRGRAHFETLLTSTIAQPLIHTWIEAPQLAYDRYPFEKLSGVVDYYAGAVSVGAVNAQYGAAQMHLGGRVVIGGDGDDVAFAFDARGPGRELPYTDVVAPDASLTADALITQPPGGKFSARGTLALTGPTSGAGTFAVDPQGVGEFGPFRFARAGGGALAGGFELQRPISQSAGWLHADRFPLAAVRTAATMPGAVIPAFPPISGTIDGDFAGGGTPDAFGLAGTFRAQGLHYQDYALGDGSVRLAGTLRDLRLASIDLRGPLGTFQGDGAFSGGTFALQGNYDGALEDLRPFTGDAGAHGPVHGPVRAVIGPNGIAVQTTGANLAGAAVRGVPVDRVAGTLLVQDKGLRIVAADGTVGGGRAVAADAGGPFLVSAPDIPVAALRGAGLPLQGGSLSLFGQADLRGKTPAFDGLVTLDDGRAAGYPVSGGVDLDLAGGTARIRRGIAALGTTYGTFAGAVDGIGTSGRNTLAYDLNASVPIGDLGEMRQALHLPLRTLEGSFSAQLRVRGNGAQPRLAGDVAIPEGSYNGLAFRDASAGLVLGAASLAAQHAHVTVGSTRAQVDAALSLAGGGFDVAVHSANANLADFDDYFDEGETLDGRGNIALAFANDGTTTRTTGRVDLADFRYRRFAFGTTDATWSERGGTVAAALGVRGVRGSLSANGTIVPANGGPVAAFQRATYNAHVQAHGVDLGTWLPPFGITAPVLGQVDVRGEVAGRWPRLGLSGDASVANGSLYGYAVREARVHASSDGARLAFSGGVLDFGFARFDASGSTGFDPAEPIALAIHGQSPDIAKTLATLLPKGPHYDVGGAIQADARIGGTLRAPRANVGFELTGARYASLAIPRVLGSVAYDGRTLTVNDAEATFAKGDVLIAGSLPLTLQPLGVVPDKPFSFTLGLTSLDLAPFAPFVPGPQTKLGGTVDGRLAIEGTERAPRVIGNVGIANGSYVSALDRAGISKANAQLAFTGTSVALQALKANLGSGTLDGSGLLDLPFAPTQRNYAIDLNAHGARVDSPQYGSGTIDGTMQLRSGAPMPVLSGDVAVTNASIPILSIYRSASGGGNGNGAAQGGPPFNVAFDMTAHAGRNVRVQASSPYIDIGTTGTLQIGGTLTSPKLAGTLIATPGGVFSTYNRAFRVQQAAVSFDPANGVLPYIDLRAYAHVTNPDPDPNRNAVGSADITVIVQGPADELASGTGAGITYSSSPPYSQEQIIGLLLDASVFGAVNFDSQQAGATLRGAPGESNPLLPPGVTPYQSGTITFSQEAFSVLNGQLTQRFLAPIERVLIGNLGVTDFEITVDYGGGLGYNVLKQIGKRDIYASFGQTLGNPLRTTGGFTARPDAVTSIQFNYFTQNGNPTILTNTNGLFGTQKVRGIEPLSNRQGFTFTIVRKYP